MSSYIARVSGYSFFSVTYMVCFYSTILCLLCCSMKIRTCGDPHPHPWMSFYSINCTGYLHSPPIITCTSDTDRIISVHYRSGDCTLSMLLVVLLKSPLFIIIIILAAAMLVNLQVTPCCVSTRMRRSRRATAQRSQRMAHHDNPKQESLSWLWAHGGAHPPHPTQYLLCARVYLWRSPGRIYDWSTKARDSPAYPIFGCLRKRESSPCPTHFHNSS